MTGLLFTFLLSSNWTWFINFMIPSLFCGNKLFYSGTFLDGNMLVPLLTVTHISLSCFAFSNQMEMLQAKQQEETKRLREQMEAEAKAQRDQMDNMMKASMKQAEEDRRAFMQENQALNQRLVEMQKANKGMQQKMENLKQQLQRNQSRQQEVRKPGFFDKAMQIIPALMGVAALPKCSVM